MQYQSGIFQSLVPVSYTHLDVYKRQRGGSLKYVNNPYAFTATIPVVDNYSGVAKVEFAVWSDKDGQDDLLWHAGTEISPGTWQTYVNYASHKKDTGTYNVHVYATDNCGNRALISATQTTVTGDVNGPTATSITPAQSFSGRTCTVSVEGVTDAEAGTEGYESGVKTVKFAVWTAENGQDDIQWLTGKNLGNGKWQITFDVADHNYDSGLYYIHVNGYDNAGNYRLMKTTTATATGDFKAPTRGGSLKYVNNPYAFTATIPVVDNYSGVAKVEFAVWKMCIRDSTLSILFHKGSPPIRSRPYPRPHSPLLYCLLPAFQKKLLRSPLLSESLQYRQTQIFSTGICLIPAHRKAVLQ